MSLAATRWAWAQRLCGHEKITLLALADRANAENECWPSLAVLASYCGIARSTVANCLNRLEAKGYIDRLRPPAHIRGMQTTRYYLRLDNTELAQLTNDAIDAINTSCTRASVVPNPSQSETSPGAGLVREPDEGWSGSETGVVREPDGGWSGSETGVVREPDEGSPGAGHESTIEPINEPKSMIGQIDLKKTHIKSTEIEPLNGKAFERFWHIYPKKRKKKTAHGIWQRKQLNTKLDTILVDIAERRRRDVYWRDGYIPDPTTYLSQERWEDDITPHRPDSPARRKSGAEILAEGCKNAFK